MNTGTACSQADTPAAHSKCFGPSSSHSWLHCPFSAKARSEMPDTPSIYAKTGSLAHELCEIKIKRYFGMIAAEEYDKRLAEIQANELYDDSMLINSDTYLAAVKELSIEHYDSAPIAYVEEQIKYDDLCGSDGFGTSDCILLGGDTLTVVDYKNGQGVAVSAVDNPQMRLYAYGALRSVVVPGLYDIKKIVMCIVQPNLNSITTDVISADELLGWVDSIVKPAVQKIQSGSLERVPGKWCKEGFCPNFAQCRAWREAFASVYADYETEYSQLDTDALTPDELGQLYSRASVIEDWIKKLRSKVESLILNDRVPVKGWKAVEGRAGNRAFTDPAAAFKELHDLEHFDTAMFYSTAPLSPAKVESLVGKEIFARVCGKYITQPKGKPAVVPESDRRKAIDNSAAADFEDLADAPKNK
ncbi:MAG: DUF2800 domain-containing protein [Ruminococcus sp.]|nr:DUF2800 domain-containing protein [Ruminococcus sp.]